MSESSLATSKLISKSAWSAWLAKLDTDMKIKRPRVIFIKTNFFFPLNSHLGDFYEVYQWPYTLTSATAFGSPTYSLSAKIRQWHQVHVSAIIDSE